MTACHPLSAEQRRSGKVDVEMELRDENTQSQRRAFRSSWRVRDSDGRRLERCGHSCDDTGTLLTAERRFIAGTQYPAIVTSLISATAFRLPIGQHDVSAMHLNGVLGNSQLTSRFLRGLTQDHAKHHLPLPGLSRSTLARIWGTRASTAVRVRSFASLAYSMAKSQMNWLRKAKAHRSRSGRKPLVQGKIVG